MKERGKKHHRSHSQAALTFSIQNRIQQIFPIQQIGQTKFNEQKNIPIFFITN